MNVEDLINHLRNCCKALDNSNVPSELGFLSVILRTDVEIQRVSKDYKFYIDAYHGYLSMWFDYTHPYRVGMDVYVKRIPKKYVFDLEDKDPEIKSQLKEIGEIIQLERIDKFCKEFMTHVMVYGDMDIQPER